MERIAPVTRAGVDHRARERAGELGDLTDVDVEEALAKELSHEAMLGQAVTSGQRRDGEVQPSRSKRHEHRERCSEREGDRPEPR